jgi:hypothetical protein
MKNKFIYSVLIVSLLFLAIAIGFNFDLIRHFSSSIPGRADYTDGPFFMWNIWWVKKAILAHISPYFTSIVFYPQNVNLSFHTLTVFFGIISFIPEYFLSLVKIYNLIYILSFIMSGLGTYLVINYLTKNKLASFLGGVIFAFTPYIFGHIYAGHLNLVNIWTLPFFVYFLYLFYENNSWKNLAFLTFVVVAQTYIDFHYLLFMFMATIIFVIWRLIFDPSKIITKKNLVSAIIIVAVWFIVSFPLLSATYKTYKNTNQTGATYEYTDLYNYLRPSPFHPIFGKIQSDFIDKMGFLGSKRENTVFLGYTALALAILTLIFVKNKEKWLWVIVFLVFFILSLGPKLQINGLAYNALPYKLLEKLPLFSSGLVASRFVVMAILSLSVLSGYFVAYMSENIKNKKIFYALYFVLVVLILFEFYPGRIELDPLTTSPYFDKIQKENNDSSVLYARPYPRTMYYQTIFDKNLLEGYLGRRVQDYYSGYYNNLPGISYFYNPDRPLNESDLDKDQVMSEMKKLKIKYIILDKFSLNDANYHKLANYLEQNLNIKRNYDDNLITEYEI